MHLICPPQVVGLVLSDVIGDQLDTIASGPTVPNTVTKPQVLQLLQKYNLKHKLPLSILSHLQTKETGGTMQVPVENGCYVHVQNVIIGNNRTATQAAHSAAKELGYKCHIWSHSIHGEAKDIGKVYGKIAHSLIASRANADQLCEEEMLSKLLASTPASIQQDLTALLKQLPQLSKLCSPPLCLISAGEPTVTVREGATGTGGRSQELALSFGLELEKLSSVRDDSSRLCVLACVGTDGQDGPRGDAAGAMVDKDTARLAKKEGLNPERFLENNDSHTFFSKLCSGKYLIQTGLTGTNVMDIHILLVKKQEHVVQ